MATTKATKAAPAKGTGIARAKVQLPANAQAIMAEKAAALATQLAAPTGKGISVTQSKMFRFPDDSTVDSFKGIIVDFVSVNAFYENEFDPKTIVPPNCFAIGRVQNDLLERSESSPDPQPEDADDLSCKACWANQWKSAAKGAGKACKNGMKLAILCDDGELRPLNISSTGLKAYGAYVRDVVQAFGCAPLGVMTEFSFDPKVDYSSVRCSNPVQLNEDQLAVVMSRMDDAEAMLMVEPDVSEFEAKVVALRAKPAKPAKPAAKARRT